MFGFFKKLGRWENKREKGARIAYTGSEPVLAGKDTPRRPDLARRKAIRAAKVARRRAITAHIYRPWVRKMRAIQGLRMMTRKMKVAE